MNGLIFLGLFALALLVAAPVALIVLFIRLNNLQRRVQMLEKTLSAPKAHTSPAPPASAQPVAAPRPVSTSAPPQPPVVAAPAAATSTPSTAPSASHTAQPSAARPVLQPSLIERVTSRIKRWFSQGNVPVKVGMLVSLIGVAALLRYANTQGWMQLPMELRLAGISAAALASIVFAWRKRNSHPSFAQAVQGGAIGTLLLVIFAASKRYDMLDSSAAFALSIVLIASMAVMAVLQHSRTLAILGVLAGFMAPLWLSSGGGNHVALFSYYALLNAGIFAIAWLRPWRELNLLGFAFTFGIGSLWGVLEYSTEQFASTEPFLLLFFALYLIIPILYTRRDGQHAPRIDGSLLFGTPLFAFALQAGLLKDQPMLLALCAIGLALLYAVLAKSLMSRLRYQLLAKGYAVLAVGFATLAVPLALSAKATSAVFALEGAGLVWLGWQQERRLPRITGICLQLIAAFALTFSATSFQAAHQPVFNAALMGGLLIAIAGFASAWAYWQQHAYRFSAVAYIWGLLWWMGSAWNDINQFIPQHSKLHVLLLVSACTGLLAAWAWQHLKARLLSLTVLTVVFTGFCIAFLQWAQLGQPFAGWGLAAWVGFALLSFMMLRLLAQTTPTHASNDQLLAQLLYWLLVPTVISLSAWSLGQRFALSAGWVGLLLVLPWLGMTALSMYRWAWLRHPLGERFDAWQQLLQGCTYVAIGLWWFFSLWSSAASAPLPWLPLINPLELAEIAALVLLAVDWQRDSQLQNHSRYRLILSLAALLLVTLSTLRAVHHWGDVPWRFSSLFASGLAQTSLTLIWSLLGVIGWVAGSRHARWSLWLSGAILMGIVLLKLLLIDRSNLGDLLGIGAFIAYGLLCTAVGWLAPAPPRRLTETSTAHEELS